MQPMAIRRLFVLTTALAISAGLSDGWSDVLAADIPLGQVNESEDTKRNPPSPPDHSPGGPLSIDPGIVVPPPADPHPKSVVEPPIVDPNMPIHPEEAPTTKQPSQPSVPAPPAPSLPGEPLQR
jgi:hypothetical protein